MGNSDSQPKSGSIGAEDTIYISVSTLRCTTQFIHDTLLTTDYSIQRVYILITNTYLLYSAKKINLIDQSYNSNPLSLKSAIKNFDKINSKKSNKYLLIGDMLELGSHSKKLHQSIAPIINQTKIDKVFVKGKMASIIFTSISKSKKGKILLNNSQIIELIRKDLNNNDYLMIKASLATGFNDIVKDLKGLH